MIEPTSNIKAYQNALVDNKASRSEELETIKEAHRESQARVFTQIMSEVQSSAVRKSEENSFEIRYQEFQEFLDGIGYEGEALASLNQEEAAELVSEDGFFGIKKTSERIAQFVMMGANGDEELLREGRKGVLQGLKEAESIWGGSLPEISYETIEKAVDMIDQALKDGGFSVLDEKV
jgi:hypothetical protein